MNTLNTMNQSSETVNLLNHPTDKRPEKNKQSQKGKKKKCNKCKKKLNMIYYTCKCGKMFCFEHLSPHNHNCTYDYITEKKKQIQKNNPVIVAKFEKI